jgi:predicted dehydrogenase
MGIIGCGKVTTMFHLRAIADVEEVEVSAVADPDGRRMEDVRRRAGAENGYLDYRELLSDPDVDAVAVNTPPMLHEGLTLDALRAGKHVLCEKPLAQSVEGCLHVKEAQEAAGLVVSPVHNYAFTPCLDRALELIGSGEIGAPQSIKLRFDNNLWSYGSKTDFRLKDRHGIVEDLLPHVLSVAHVFTDPVELVEARGWTKSYDVMDNLEVVLRMGDGAVIDCSMNWTSLIPGYKVEVAGDSGAMEMDLMKAPRLRHPAFREQYRHFAAVVEGSESPRFTVDDEAEMLGLMAEVVGRLDETDISGG